MKFNDKIINFCVKSLDKMDTARLATKTKVAGITTICDIPYIDDGNKYHLLDVYFPQNISGKLPIIIDIHGGAWLYGTKEINKHYCMGLAKAGFVVVNISYRLLQENGIFPNILLDVFAAFDWVNANIAQYNGDLNNIFLTGDSAGGHLSLMAQSALCDPQFKKELNISTQISFNALALTCAVTDISKWVNLKISLVKHIATMFFGEDYKNNRYLRYATIKNNKIEDFPPMFLISGDGDFMSKQVKKFAEECKNRGAKYELMYIDKKSQTNKLEHVYNVLYPEWDESKKVTEGMIKFFLSHVN